MYTSSNMAPSCFLRHCIQNQTRTIDRNAINTGNHKKYFSKLSIIFVIFHQVVFYVIEYYILFHNLFHYWHVENSPFLDCTLKKIAAILNLKNNINLHKLNFGQICFIKIFKYKFNDFQSVLLF